MTNPVNVLERLLLLPARLIGFSNFLVCSSSSIVSSVSSICVVGTSKSVFPPIKASAFVAFFAARLNELLLVAIF